MDEYQKAIDKVNWLKDCEICNVRLCSQLDNYKEQGLSERAAAEQMEKDCDGLWDKDKIRDRYRYYTKSKGGGKSPTTEEIDAVKEKRWREAYRVDQVRRFLKRGAEALSNGLFELEEILKEWDDLTPEQQMALYIDHCACKWDEEQAQWERMRIRREQQTYAENWHREWIKLKGSKTLYTKYRKFVNAEAKRKDAERKQEFKRRYSDPSGKQFSWFNLASVLGDTPTMSPIVTFVAAGFSLIPDELQGHALDGIYKAFAKLLHPDTGKDKEKMQRLNALRDKLKEHFAPKN